MQSNNYVTVPPLSPSSVPITISPHVTLAADAADMVQREALGFFQVTAFTSYTELRPEELALLLVLRARDEVGGDATVGPVTTAPSQEMPLMMQLYTSPDYRSPLDPSAKVQSDRRIYAEVRQTVSQSLSRSLSQLLTVTGYAAHQPK